MQPTSMLLSACAAVFLTGCASFNAMPDPVITRAAADAIIQPISVPTALQAMPGEITLGTGKTYRNQISSLRILPQHNSHYLDFLLHLSRQVKGANFGLDFAALSLSSVSAIAHAAANELATAAAIVTGTRSSLDKEVYFDKTLPAIVSAMEARRLSVRADIEKRMKEEDVETYTLEQGFADVMRYQMATTIDGAIQDITSAAGQQEATAEQEYKDAVNSCSPGVDVRTVWGQINDRVYDLVDANSGEKLAAAAKAVGAEIKPDIGDQAAAITKVAITKCKVGEAQAMLAQIPST